MKVFKFSFFQVIAAEGEHKASRALRHAAEVIADSPAALQVVLMSFDGIQSGTQTQTDTDRHSQTDTDRHHPNFSCMSCFCFQLRYLQTLNSISAENNSTIIFPVPIDIMSTFMSMHQKQV